MTSGAKELWRQPGFHMIAALLGLSAAVMLFTPAMMLFSALAGRPIIQGWMRLLGDDDQAILLSVFAVIWPAGILLTYLIATVMSGRRQTERSC